MPRAIWSGTISFGLVNVPVKAFTGARDHAVHFNQLDKRSGARIKNQTVSEKSGKPVDRDDIELGFEVSSGRYVTFDREEIEELRPESTRSVEVSDFVPIVTSPNQTNETPTCKTNTTRETGRHIT